MNLPTVRRGHLNEILMRCNRLTDALRPVRGHKKARLAPGFQGDQGRGRETAYIEGDADPARGLVHRARGAGITS